MFIAALLAALQPASPPQIHWECSRGTRSGDGLLLAIRRLDREGRPLGDHLRWHIPGNEGLHGRLEWAFAAGTIRGWSLWSSVSLSRAPSGRMWAIIRADGRELSRVPLALPTDKTWDGLGRTMVTLDYRSGPMPGLSGPPLAPFPPLGEAREVELLIEEAGGAELARARVAMPDWDRVRPEIGLLRSALGEDAAAYRRRCRDVVTPIRVELRRAN